MRTAPCGLGRGLRPRSRAPASQRDTSPRGDHHTSGKSPGGFARLPTLEDLSTTCRDRQCSARADHRTQPALCARR